jgi:hypothetical protein
MWYDLSKSVGDFHSHASVRYQTSPMLGTAENTSLRHFFKLKSERNSIKTKEFYVLERTISSSENE